MNSLRLDPNEKIVYGSWMDMGYIHAIKVHVMPATVDHAIKHCMFIALTSTSQTCQDLLVVVNLTLIPVYAGVEIFKIFSRTDVL